MEKKWSFFVVNLFIVGALYYCQPCIAGENEALRKIPSSSIADTEVLNFLLNEPNEDIKLKFVADTPLSKQLANTYFSYLSLSAQDKGELLLSEIIRKLAEGGYRASLEQFFVSFLKKEIEKAKSAPHHMSTDPVYFVKLIKATFLIDTLGSDSSLYNVPEKIVLEYVHDDLEEGESPPKVNFFAGYLSYLYLEYLKYTPVNGVGYHLFSSGNMIHLWSNLFFPNMEKNILVNNLQKASLARDSGILLQEISKLEIISVLGKNDIQIIVEYLCGKDGQKADSADWLLFLTDQKLCAFYIIRYWSNNDKLEFGKLSHLYEWWTENYANMETIRQNNAWKIYTESKNPLDVIFAGICLKRTNYNYQEFYDIYLKEAGANKTTLEQAHNIGGPYIPPTRGKEFENHKEQIFSWLSSLTGEKIADE